MSKASLVFFSLFAFALFAFTALMCAAADGQDNYKVIHSFSGFPNDGMTTIRPVVFDRAGNMYGTTPGGGSQTGCGDFAVASRTSFRPTGKAIGRRRFFIIFARTTTAYVWTGHILTA